MSEEIEDVSLSNEEIKVMEARFIERLTKFWWDNEFSREKIIDRTDRAIEKNFPEPQRSILQVLRIQNRSQIPTFDQEALSRLISEEVPQSVKPIAEAASPILFHMIAKASQIPFIDYSEHLTPGLKSHVSLLRGLSVYAPRYNVLSQGRVVEFHWIMSRKWFRLDYLKQLFLGMAYFNSEAVSTREPDQAVYPGVREENESFWIDVSTEAPELTTVLDAISGAPPGYRYMAVPRSWYKSIAESMINISSMMGSFRVQKTDLLALVRLMLVLPTRVKAARIELQTPDDDEKLNTMANIVMADFGSDITEEIDWPTWIEVISKSYPELFGPLEELYESLFSKVAEQQLSESKRCIH